MIELEKLEDISWSPRCRFSRLSEAAGTIGKRILELIGHAVSLQTCSAVPQNSYSKILQWVRKAFSQEGKGFPEISEVKIDRNERRWDDFSAGDVIRFCQVYISNGFPVYRTFIFMRGCTTNKRMNSVLSTNALFDIALLGGGDYGKSSYACLFMRTFASQNFCELTTSFEESLPHTYRSNLDRDFF